MRGERRRRRRARRAGPTTHLPPACHTLITRVRPSPPPHHTQPQPTPVPHGGCFSRPHRGAAAHLFSIDIGIDSIIIQDERASQLQVPYDPLLVCCGFCQKEKSGALPFYYVGARAPLHGGMGGHVQHIWTRHRRRWGATTFSRRWVSRSPRSRTLLVALCRPSSLDPILELTRHVPRVRFSGLLADADRH